MVRASPDESLAGSPLAFGPFVLDRAAARLRRGRHAIALRPKVWRVLCYLVERPGVLVPTADLLDAAWDGTAVTPQALTNVVGELRRALGDRAERPRWIETVHGRGYRLKATPRPLTSVGTGPSSPTQPGPAEHGAIVVGRTAERRQLAALWQRALAGARQLVFLTGEPGIGKTTLAEAFLREIDVRGAAAAGRDGVLVARGHCIEQHGEREPYMPLLLAVDELARGAYGRTVQAELRRYAPTWQVQIPWLLRGTERERVERSLQGATAVRMLREGAALFEALARRRPLVLFVDDLHWADVATIDFLRALAPRDTPARLLVLASHRSADALLAGHPAADAVRQLCAHGHARDVSLGPLGRADIEALLAARLDAADVASGLAERVEAEASGNPLFVSSVLEHLLEAGLLTSVDGDWRLAEGWGTDGGPALPDALHVVITAQLTRLDAPARAVAEAASVAGSEFSTRELAAATDQDEAGVAATCEALAAAGRLLRPLGSVTWPDGSLSSRYGFLHAVYERAVYESVPLPRRRALHARVATALEHAYDREAPRAAARLAAHFERSGERVKTVEYLGQAARNAARRFAYGQGVEYVQAALAALDGWEGDARRAREAGLQHRLGSMLAMSTGLAAPATGAALTRAWSLYDTLGDEGGRLVASAGLAIHLITSARFAEAEPHLERLLLASRTVAPGLGPLACCYAAYARSAAGRLDAARALLDEGAAGEPDERLQGFMDVPRMIASQRALVLTELGTLARARTVADEALARSRTRGTPVDIAHAATFATEAAAWQRDRDAGLATAELAHTVAEENGLPSYRTLAAFYRASLAGDQTRVADMERALAERRAVGDRWQESVLLGLLADAQRETGDLSAALATLDAADAFVAATNERHFEAELLRIRALCHERAPDSALACCRQALAAARRTGSRLWALRAATALARLGDPDGPAILAEAYGALAAEPDTPDLCAARAQLEGGAPT